MQAHTRLAHYSLSVSSSQVLGLANEADLQLALVLADTADAISMNRFRAHDLQTENKIDLTPVTDADRGVERQLREILEQERSEDSIIGEEFDQRGSADRTWIIDPIDGTKNFLRGVPVWATLIALRDKDGIGLGVVSSPALNRRWWALRDHGAWIRESDREHRLRASAVSELSQASFSFSDSVGWKQDALTSLIGATWRHRAYGDFWSHCLVAEGAVDIAAEPELALYDYAALVPIVEESGGRITDFRGTPLPVDSFDAHPSVLTTNNFLHQSVTELLNS